MDYKSHRSVDSLAFGHCDFSYRNLGRPSLIQIKQEANSFEVVVNHRQCFWSDKVSQPNFLSFIANILHRSNSLPVISLVYLLPQRKQQTPLRRTNSFSRHLQPRMSSLDKTRLPNPHLRIPTLLRKMPRHPHIPPKKPNLPIYTTESKS